MNKLAVIVVVMKKWVKEINICIEDEVVYLGDHHLLSTCEVFIKQLLKYLHSTNILLDK